MRLFRVTSSFPVLVLCSGSLAACSGTDPGPGPTPDVTEAPGASQISISPSDNFTVLLGGVGRVSARVHGDPGAAIRFRSSDPSVVSVDSITGEIRGISLNTATITAARAGTVSPASSIDVTVLPTAMAMTAMQHRQMVRTMITEVCPNRAESSLLESVPDADVRMIHEFHDCQPLIERGRYQSVVGIYAHRNLTTFPSPEDFVDGRVAALIVNFGTKDQKPTYAPLGLAHGTSCLFLKWSAEASPDKAWTAAVVSSTSLPKGNCDYAKWSDLPSTLPARLEVKLQPNATGPGTLKLAPAVARWDWDPERGINYMGVRCGERNWCEIGPTGFTPSKSLVMKNGKNMFKGYYDEQYLADAQGALTDAFGTVSPPENSVKPKRNDKWHKMATIQITGPDRSQAVLYYTDRMQLKARSAGAGRVHSTGTMTMKSRKLPANPTQDQLNWEVQVNGKKLKTAIPGEKMTHRAHPTEGESRFKNVRWRWDPLDERVWGYCPEVGCCESGRLAQ